MQVLQLSAPAFTWLLLLVVVAQGRVFNRVWLVNVEERSELFDGLMAVLGTRYHILGITREKCWCNLLPVAGQASFVAK
jgi:hypothetical protein